MPKNPSESNSKNFLSRIKKSLSHKRTRRIVLAVVIVIVLAAMGVGGWSIYYFQFKPYQQTAIVVNDVTFDMRYYINMQKVYYGNAPMDITIPQFPDFVEAQVIQNEVIIQGAAALGIQIDRNDIKAEMENLGLPVTRENVDLYLAQKLVEKEVPANQPQVHVQAMLLESESAGEEAKARVQGGESFTDVANEVSRVSAAMISQGDMGWITKKGAELTLGSTNFGNMVFEVEPGVLSGPVYDETISKQYGYWLLRAVEITEPSDNTTSARAHVEAILVGSEQQADEIRGRIIAGEDMNELAKEYSELSGAEGNGAELGWVTQTSDKSSVYDAVFDLPLNSVTYPIGDNQMQTQGGYWVFNVLEKDENRELSSTQESTLRDDFLNRCAAAITANPDHHVESVLTQEMKDFAFDEVVLAQGKGSVLIGTTSLAAAEAGVSYSFQIEIYGNRKGNTWSITEGKLPEGLSLNESTGVISGTPKLAGGAGITVRVSNKYHYWEQEFTVQIHLPVSISTESLPNGQVDEIYNVALEVFADTYNYTWSIIDGSLPDGLSLSEATGRISGTPTTAGTYNFTVQVDDSFATATKNMSIVIE